MQTLHIFFECKVIKKSFNYQIFFQNFAFLTIKHAKKPIFIPF